MQVPEFIYSQLPVVYVASGVICLSTLELNGPGILSAGLLIGAGALTAFWRHQHRWHSIEKQTARTKRGSQLRRPGPRAAAPTCF